MKKWILLIIAIAALALSSGCASADKHTGEVKGGGKIQRTADQVGSAIDKAANQAGKGLETAASKTGEALGTASEKTGGALERAWQKVKGWFDE